jgi:hypothetical protein
MDVAATFSLGLAGSWHFVIAIAAVRLFLSLQGCNAASH